MTTFDSTKASLSDLLREIKEGKIQLPDFQRGWVWDDDHIRDLLVSIARSFPIGAVMLLEAGGDVRFETRPVEGLEDLVPKGRAPEKLILDGQQRLTTLTQALSLNAPVQTRTAKGKRIQRHYYFDIRKAVEAPHALDEAIVAVDENRQLRSNFGRDVELDLSTTELECQQLHFPCSQILGSDEWEATLHRVAPEHFALYMAFRSQVLTPFRGYHLPVILLKKETSKEAVCLVFEKVNTGGVQLSVFELITASYAADGYNLMLGYAELPRPALFLAGRAFVKYRREGGNKTNVLPDFFIGAHAAVLGCGILTRDARRYRNYFPGVPLIEPEGWAAQ